MLTMAWRNLWRNRTRTVITASAIAVVYALYLISSGVQEWTFEEMRTAATKAAGGDVLVQAAGYHDLPENDRYLEGGDDLMRRVSELSGVEAVAPRVLIQGLLSTSASSVPVSVRGIDPESEAQIHDLSPYLTTGVWFDGTAEDPLILGGEIARELEVEIGDRVILTATDTTGEMRRALFHLTGIISTGSAATDRALAFTTVAAARASVGMDSGLTQIGVVTRERAVVAHQVEALDPSAIEALPWDVAMPELIGFIEMKKGGGAMLGVLLFLVVLFSIINTFLMIVMERVREFGLLGALGLTPRQSAFVLLTETSLLALVAMGIGLAIALPAHFWIATHGIDFTAMYGESIEVAGVSLTDTRIRSSISPVGWASASAAVFFMVLIAALYPAWKATRLAPAEAMRFFE